MYYGWYCTWDNNASHFEDYDSCGAWCKVFYKDRSKAEQSARKHEYKTGHKCRVVERDGRSIKSFKKA